MSLAKKYHTKLFKNKSDKLAGRPIGVYAQEFKHLVEARKKANLPYADASGGDPKYFDSIKFVEGASDPLKNELSYKSRKHFKADGSKSKDHPDNRKVGKGRTSRAKDPNRFAGTDLEYLQTTSDESQGILTQERYRSREDAQGKVKRRHAPKFRGAVAKKSSMIPDNYQSILDLTKQKPETKTFSEVDLQPTSRGFKQVSAGDKRFTAGRQGQSASSQFVKEGEIQTAVFRGGERQSAVRKATAQQYMLKGIGTGYKKTQAEADAESSSIRARYPDHHQYLAGVGVSQLQNLTPNVRRLRGEYEPRRKTNRGALQGYTPQPALTTIKDVHSARKAPKNLRIKEKDGTISTYDFKLKKLVPYKKTPK